MNTAFLGTRHTPLITNGLVAYWALDEGTRVTANDSSINHYTSSLVNSPTWTQGINKNALSFSGSTTSGTSSYVITNLYANNNSFKTGSIVWWMKPNTVWNDNTIRDVWGISDGSNSLVSEMFSNNQFYIGWANGVADRRINIPSPSSIWTSGSWGFYAFTWGTGSILYVNNIQVGVNTSAPDVAITQVPFTIGKGFLPYSQSAFNGAISDFRIYNRILSPSELTLIYNRQG